MNPFSDSDVTATQKEYKLQVATKEHLDSAFKPVGLRYIHIPNRPGNAADGFFKKQMGAKAGASDWLLSWWDQHLHGGFIELKIEDGVVSSAQNKFLSSWAAIGWKTAVCRTVRGVHNKLCEWGLKPVHSNCVEPDYRSEQGKFKDSYDFFKPC